MCVCVFERDLWHDDWIFPPPIHSFSKLLLLFIVTGFWSLSQHALGKRQVVVLTGRQSRTCMSSECGQHRPWVTMPVSLLPSPFNRIALSSVAPPQLYSLLIACVNSWDSELGCGSSYCSSYSSLSSESNSPIHFLVYHVIRLTVEMFKSDLLWSDKKNYTSHTFRQ